MKFVLKSTNEVKNNAFYTRNRVVTYTHYIINRLVSATAEPRARLPHKIKMFFPWEQQKLKFSVMLVYHAVFDRNFVRC